MNRINNPVSDFTLEPKVNQLSGDPNAAIYVSKIVRLQKSADSLKVLFDAYRHSTNDIRVMYRLLRNDTTDSQQLYEFFPGYDNLDENGNVINSSKNKYLYFPFNIQPRIQTHDIFWLTFIDCEICHWLCCD